MTIVQKRASNRAEFNFEEEALRYSIKDPSGTASYTVTYEDIPSEYSEFEEKKVFFRNAGVIWVVIGCAGIAVDLAGEGPVALPFWLIIGLGCLAYYRYSTVRFRIFETNRGKIFVIEDKQRDRVLEEIDRRRTDQLRKRYARVIDASNPEREVARFDWLAKTKVISEEQRENLLVELRLGIADKMNERRDA